MASAVPVSCGYCKSRVSLERLNNNALLVLMQEYNPKYDRHTRFCRTCRVRAGEKLARRLHNQGVAARRASRTTDERTNSYSNVSRNQALSSSSSSSSSSDSSRMRKHDESNTGRNVAKRSFGRPTRLESSNSSPSQPANQSTVFRQTDSQTYSSRSNQQASTSNNQQNESPRDKSHRSIRSSVTPAPVDFFDSSNDNASNMQAAPLPRKRAERTNELRALSPERMLSLSPQERALEFRLYNRGSGG